VLSMPFLSIISQAFKDHERYLVLSPGRGDLFFGWDTFHLVDIGDSEKTTALLSKYHEWIFDLGTGTDHLTDWVTQEQLKYGTLVGFSKTKSIPREVSVPRPIHIPLWQQFISLVSPLGIAKDPIPEFGIQTRESDESYAELLLNCRTGLPLVCLAPGAHFDHRKRWPPEHFATFIREFHAKRPCRFVLVGDRSETEIGDAITNAVEFEIDNLIGLTTLGSLVHILRQSRLLIANDNGTMHLGGLIGTPTIGLFGPSDPRVFGPLGIRSTVIAADSRNISDIDPEEVEKESMLLME